MAKSWVGGERIKVFVVVCVEYILYSNVSLLSGMELGSCLCGREFVQWRGGGGDLHCGFVGDDVLV